MNYEEAVAYIEDIPRFTTKNSLDHTRECLRRLGDPQRKFRVIHVAGTNGKGSTCAFITSVLREAGYSCGLFTSPHLVEINERFQINEEVIDDDTFLRAFEKVKKLSDELVAEGSYHPTYFETLLLMGMVIFAEAGVDYVTLETGLGGRLDATTAVEDPAACVITSISLDHMQYLGNTIPQIAGEKAGIIKMGVPVVFDDTDKDASAVIGAKAKEMKAVSLPVSKLLYDTEDSSEGILLKEKGEKGLRLSIPFEAPYQAQNAEIAVTALRILRDQKGIFTGITDAVICEGISAARWPGRMEKASENVYLDGAHNPGGIAAFIQAAGKIQKRTGKKAWLLFAAVADKEYETMAKELCEGLNWAGIGVVHMNSDRGLSAGRLSDVFKTYASCQVVSYEDTEEAMEQMQNRAGDDLLFCAGSLYLIGELKVQLKKGEKIQ